MAWREICSAAWGRVQGGGTPWSQNPSLETVVRISIRMTPTMDVVVPDVADKKLVVRRLRGTQFFLRPPLQLRGDSTEQWK